MYKKPIWNERKDDMVRLIEEGKSLKEMGEYFGATQFAVKSAMQRMGLAMKPEDIIRRQTIRIRAIHNDPEKRAKWLASVVESNKQPAKREIHRQQMLERWKDPEYQQFIREVVADQYKNNPEYRERVRQGSVKARQITKKRLEYRKWFESLSKFEQQLELLKTGKANLAENWNRRYQ